MPKKAKKGSKKGSKGGFDWATADREKWAHVEVRNNRWCTMRFTALLNTTETLETVRRLIVDRHGVTDREGLRMYLGSECAPESQFRAEHFGLRLQDLTFVGGSKNDKFVTVVTYEYNQFESALRLPPLEVAAPLVSSAKGASTAIPKGVRVAAAAVPPPIMSTASRGSRNERATDLYEFDEGEGRGEEGEVGEEDGEDGENGEDGEDVDDSDGDDGDDGDGGAGDEGDLEQDEAQAEGGGGEDADTGEAGGEAEDGDGDEEEKS